MKKNTKKTVTSSAVNGGSNKKPASLIKTEKKKLPVSATITKPNESPSNPKVPASKKQEFPIVGIGASAGGLEALELFFSKIPRDCGMAFIIIQHLDPSHVGIMPELLQRITPMKVYQSVDNMKVKPSCVYVIPPNKSMSILNETLFLFEPVVTRGLRLPIDVFFRSLADDRQDRSIGIILSGMGSDGSLGIKAIKEKNGIVLVQSPNTAKFDSMPRNALESVNADIIAPAEELAKRLIDFLSLPPIKIFDSDLDDKSKSSIDKIIILLREQMGHDFSLYKKNTLFRRIERRKRIHQIDKIHHYVRFLQENPKEVGILFKELLIGITCFFRDSHVWDVFRNKALPDLLESLPNGYVLRVWVPGCSTGEEAYSIAILFKEAKDKMKIKKNLSMILFATDLDHEAITIARIGLYPKNISADVSPERLGQFFTLEPEGYRVNAAIREMVVFAPQNVIKDPPFTKLDILSCRNMLIYMETELQKRVLSLFRYSLNKNGIMVLGSAETLGNTHDEFEALDNRYKIYKRLTTPLQPKLLDFPDSFQKLSLTTGEKKTAAMTDNLETLADRVILQQFSPASVLVNAKGDIIYITGRTGKYLEPQAGKANFNIYAMAREGLREELPGAFRKALQSTDRVVIRNIKIGSNGNTIFADIIIQQLEKPDLLHGMIMVVLSDVTDLNEPEPLNALKGKKTRKGKDKELEIALQLSKEELQITREEMQTSQEELKSTNEELQSINEELQSTNEELTTSKEEMQSLNEELQTVNIELQKKITDLITANNDMKNLLNSTEIATLFLDKELNIRRFTEPVTTIMKIRNADVGRPFTDQVSDLDYPEMETDVKEVLRTLVFIEKNIAAKDGRWFSVRIMPYRTMDDRIDGIVITLTNITWAKNLEAELNKTILELNATKNVNGQ